MKSSSTSSYNRFHGKLRIMVGDNPDDNTRVLGAKADSSGPITATSSRVLWQPWPPWHPTLLMMRTIP
jgi:hypothetical protein